MNMLKEISMSFSSCNNDYQHGSIPIKESAKYLLSALSKIKKYCEDNRSERIKGFISNIDALYERLQKICDSDRPKTIGFFGGQKRGKSTLINCLIGVDLLPTSPIPATSVIVEIKNNTDLGPNEYNVRMDTGDGAVIIRESKMPLGTLKQLLENFGTRSGDCKLNIERIVIEGLFSESDILKNGGILLDTPGCEMAFEDVSQQNSKDSILAMNALKGSQVVLFVERIDYCESKSSQTLFEEEVKKMSPIFVASFKDKDDSSDELVTKSKIIKLFGQTNPDKIVCVSGKYAKQKDRYIESGLELLKKCIIKELDMLKPEYGLYNFLQEFNSVLDILNNKSGIDTVRQTFQYAILSFSQFEEACVNSKLKELSKSILNKYGR